MQSDQREHATRLIVCCTQDGAHHDQGWRRDPPGKIAVGREVLVEKPANTLRHRPGLFVARARALLGLKAMP
jgi:hypothetical protein